MKAIRLSAPEKFEQVEIDPPAAPGPGQALVRSHVMGICGTDISGYLGKMPFFSYPRVPGPELGVEVVAVGDGVTNVKPGDRCSVEPYMNCGECYACRKGNGNCCEKLNVIGVMVDGGLCERFAIRAEKLHPSSKLNMEQLALVETLAIGCHANDRGNPGTGDHAECRAIRSWLRITPVQTTSGREIDSEFHAADPRCRPCSKDHGSLNAR